MMTIPGFTAEQSLATSRMLYRSAGKSLSGRWWHLHPMQESENYDTGGGEGGGGDGGGGADGASDGQGDGSDGTGNGTQSVGADAGTPDAGDMDPLLAPLVPPLNPIDSPCYPCPVGQCVYWKKCTTYGGATYACWTCR